jgi:hypothetical protein
MELISPALPMSLLPNNLRKRKKDQSQSMFQEFNQKNHLASQQQLAVFQQVSQSS